MSSIIGRKITYSPTTLEAYREHLEKYDLPEFTIQHFIEVAVDYQNGVFVGEDKVIGQVTGMAAETVEDFVLANRAIFAPQI